MVAWREEVNLLIVQYCLFLTPWYLCFFLFPVPPDPRECLLLSAEVAPSQYCTFGVSRIFKLLPLNSQQSVLRSTRLRPVLTTPLLGQQTSLAFVPPLGLGHTPLISIHLILSSSQSKAGSISFKYLFPHLFWSLQSPCCLIMLGGMAYSFFCLLPFWIISISEKWVERFRRTQVPTSCSPNEIPGQGSNTVGFWTSDPQNTGFSTKFSKSKMVLWNAFNALLKINNYYILSISTSVNLTRLKHITDLLVAKC